MQEIDEFKISSSEFRLENGNSKILLPVCCQKFLYFLKNHNNEKKIKPRVNLATHLQQDFAVAIFDKGRQNSFSRSTKGRLQLGFTSGYSRCTFLGHPLAGLFYLAILSSAEIQRCKEGDGSCDVIGCSLPLSLSPAGKREIGAATERSHEHPMTSQLPSPSLHR
jgi:hypothetical protein